MKKKLTQRRVDESLNEAVKNGYELHLWEAANIAEDLSEYDQFFEDADQAVLLPLVEDWKKRHS